MTKAPDSIGSVPDTRCEARYRIRGLARQRCALPAGHLDPRHMSGRVRWDSDAGGSGVLRTLFLDIETFPNLVYTWGLHNQDVGVSQVVQATRVACFAARFLGESEIKFHRDTPGSGPHQLAHAAWQLLDDADIIVHYNGARFDIPHLNRLILQAGLPPPSPFRQIDLLSAVRRKFRFPSNSLRFVSQELGLGSKVPHDGFDLWVRCMAGDSAAWRLMEKYNKQDVVLTEDLYHFLLPWIPGHPAHSAHPSQDTGGTGGGPCPTCTRGVLHPRGTYRTRASVYYQWRCNVCYAWFRSTKRTGGATAIGV